MPPDDPEPLGPGADGTDRDVGDPGHGLDGGAIGLIDEAPAPPAVRPPTTRTVSQEIAARLAAAGTRFCFTVPGESFLPLLDDLPAAGIRVVVTRHEGGASFMAEAATQLTGRPQAVLVTRGVGAANAGIGIHTARQDSAPLVALVGQAERPFLGREAFQETDLVHGIGSLAKWAGQLDDPEDVDRQLEAGLRHLQQGRPGPILLSLPEDILTESVTTVPQPSRAIPRVAQADQAQVRQVLHLLAASERGVIVCGGGVARARATKRIVSLSEALAMPVMAAWRRPDAFPNDHPHYLGMTGYWAAPTVKRRLLDADVVLFLGCRLSQVATFDYAIPAAGQRWAHVDLAPRVAHAGLGEPTVSVATDVSRFLDVAWSLLRGAALDAEMRDRRASDISLDREAFVAASAVSGGIWDGPGVHPGRVIETLQRILPGNAVITSDAGNFAGWLNRGYRFTRPGTFLGPTSGAMGYALPAAVAASLAEPDRISVAICGDGGFAMTMAELETAVREDARPIVIVFDNSRYGTIAMHQSREGRSTRTSELGPLDVVAVAEACGALGIPVPDDAAFEPALREALAARRPCVLHLRLDRSWVSVDEHGAGA